MSDELDSKGFMDATCPKCKSHIGWYGDVTDRPACKCGHQVPREQLESDKAKMDEFRRLLATSPHKATGAEKRKQRVAAGLTLMQAAKMLGISLTELSSIEMGTAEASQRVCEAMSNAYGLDDGKDG